MARTEEQMKWLLKDKLYIGKTVKVERWATRNAQSGAYKFIKSRKGEVIALYRYIFMVRFGNNRECFRYSQIFEKGVERVILS